MSIQKWHPGKLIILWSWGGTAAALALTGFLGSPVRSAPVLHLFELLFILFTFITLSAITWHWFGGKESS
jgi:hypothetical protein